MFRLPWMYHDLSDSHWLDSTSPFLSKSNTDHCHPCFCFIKKQVPVFWEAPQLKKRYLTINQVVIATPPPQKKRKQRSWMGQFLENAGPMSTGTLRDLFPAPGPASLDFSIKVKVVFLFTSTNSTDGQLLVRGPVVWDSDWIPLWKGIVMLRIGVSDARIPNHQQPKPPIFSNWIADEFRVEYSFGSTHECRFFSLTAPWEASLFCPDVPAHLVAGGAAGSLSSSSKFR